MSTVYDSAATNMAVVRRNLTGWLFIDNQWITLNVSGPTGSLKHSHNFTVEEDRIKKHLKLKGSSPKSKSLKLSQDQIPRKSQVKTEKSEL